MIFFSISAQISDLSTSVKLGQLAVNLCFQTETQETLSNIVPILFSVLMSLNRYQEAVALLTKLYSVASYRDEIYGLIWYHALAMDFLLDTGKTLETFENCKKFYFRNVLGREIDDESLQRLQANFLTFSSRQNQHEKNAWIKKLETFKLGEKSSLNQYFTALRLYESRDFRYGIKSSLKNTKNIPQFLKVRFSLLNIQFESIIMKRNGILKRLDDLKKNAVKSRNFLCIDLIRNFEDSLRTDCCFGDGENI